MKYLLSLLFICFFIHLRAQELTGQQLLDKAIEHHDPNGNWNSFIGNFQVTMTTPQKSPRVSEIDINLPANNFELNAIRDSIITAYIINKEKIDVIEIDHRNNEKVHFKDSEKYDRAIFMKNYYTYLYGLPMKLKDPGTLLTDKVERKTFKGKEYLVLEVKYDEHVGSDVWYFYFDPVSYQMEIYQFYKKDESGLLDKNSGEYILLSENHVVNDINMPKVRKWYYNKDDTFLGTDEITD